MATYRSIYVFKNYMFYDFRLMKVRLLSSYVQNSKKTSPEDATKCLYSVNGIDSSNYNLTTYQNKYNLWHNSYSFQNNNLNRVLLFKNNSYRNFSTSSVLSEAKEDLSINDIASSSLKFDDGSVLDLSLIPDIPKIEDILIEPSFNSLGLGGWLPSGIVQSALEYLHVTCGLPWWACIFFGTAIIRTAVLPLVIKFQKEIIVMGNTMPTIQLLQMKMNSAFETGNFMEANLYSNELKRLVEKKKINPLISLSLPLIQMPFFLSFFFGLRGMADLPVGSLKTGGLWWFEDLTTADPYYVLPIITCLTLYVSIELGLKENTVSTQQNEKMLNYLKLFMKFTPFIMFPVIMSFPGAITVYWLSTNIYSLVQSNVLKLPKVRDSLGFEQHKDNTECFKMIEKLKKSSDSNIKNNFKDTMVALNKSENMNERKSLEWEERINKMKGSLKKTNEK